MAKQTTDPYKEKTFALLKVMALLILGYVCGSNSGYGHGYTAGRCETVSTWDEYTYFKRDALEETTKITHICPPKEKK